MGLVIFGARLSGDNIGDAMHEFRVPCGAEADGLRKDSRTPMHHAMQRLIPPVIARDSKPWNRRGVALHLQRFLLHSHPGDKILRSQIWRQLWIEVWCVGRALSE